VLRHRQQGREVPARFMHPKVDAREPNGHCRRRNAMRLIALLLVAMLAAGTAAMAQQGVPPPASPPVAGESKAAAQIRDLPVSLDRIRDGLERIAGPGLLLKKVEDTPTFRVEILERQKVEELLSSLDFKSGPKPPGGIYAYEQQRVLFPAVDNPMAQPYAAFNPGELAVVTAEAAAANLLGAKYIARALKNALRASQEQASRAEVDRAIAQYCAAKPNGGAGIEMCAPRTPSR
jgi:hypothetical protein